MKGICAVFDEKLGYDPTNPESIENYAIQLTDKTFMDVILEKNNVMSDAVEAYANKLRKGGLGNLLEEVYFGYKANSNQEADFPEAGVELKVTPYEVTQKGELRAGERLVLTMINYDSPIEMEFYKSHAWEKMRLIILIYYWRNKQLNSNLLYKIGFVKLFTPPEADLEIIMETISEIKMPAKRSIEDWFLYDIERILGFLMLGKNTKVSGKNGYDKLQRLYKHIKCQDRMYKKYYIKMYS